MSDDLRNSRRVQTEEQTCQPLIWWIRSSISFFYKEKSVIRFIDYADCSKKRNHISTEILSHVNWHSHNEYNEMSKEFYSDLWKEFLISRRQQKKKKNKVRIFSFDWWMSERKSSMLRYWSCQPEKNCQVSLKKKYRQRQYLNSGLVSRFSFFNERMIREMFFLHHSNRRKKKKRSLMKIRHFIAWRAI